MDILAGYNQIRRICSLDKTIGYVHGYIVGYVKINRKDNRGYKRYAIGYVSWICAWINQKDISGYKGYMPGYVYWITGWISIQIKI